MDGSKGAFSLLPQPLLYVRAHVWSKYSVCITAPPCCFQFLEFCIITNEAWLKLATSKLLFFFSLPLNKQNIALGAKAQPPSPAYLYAQESDRKVKGLHHGKWKRKSENFFFLFTKLSQIHLLKGKLNCPKGKFKLRPKSGHPSVQGIASWACFNCND